MGGILALFSRSNPSSGITLTSPPKPLEAQDLDLSRLRAEGGRAYLLQEFVRNGFVKFVLPRDEVHADVHRTIYEKAKRMRPDDNPGNNIFPDIMELDQVLNAQTLHNALKTVVGRNYRLHPHRHCHRALNEDQAFHKDSAWGWPRMRNHKGRMVMVLYYPQKTVLDMGPTSVLKGSQYLAMNHEERPNIGENCHPEYGMWGSPEENREIAMYIDKSLEMEERFVTVEEGSICLMHYDLFHRASKRSPDSTERFMFKFQFLRVNEPCPRQDAALGPKVVMTLADPNHAMHIVHEEILMWYAGMRQDSDPDFTAEGFEALKAKIVKDAEETDRISAAYSLGRIARTDGAHQDQALLCLADAMTRLDEESRRAASFGFATAGVIAEPLLKEISESTTKEAKRARKYVFWALGEMDTVSEEASQVLLKASEGVDRYPYENACVEKLAKATANVALGLMAQRAHRANDDELFSKICQRLVASAAPLRGSPPPEDLVREEAALALLFACAAGPERAAVQRGLVDFLRQLASARESDRYVIGYASEALLSLSHVSAEARAALESVLDTHHMEDLRRMLQQRRCPRTSSTSQFIARDSFLAMHALVPQQSDGAVTVAEATGSAS